MSCSSTTTDVLNAKHGKGDATVIMSYGPGNCLSFLMVKILGQCREQKAKEKLQHTVDYLDVLLFNNNGRTERQAWEGRCDCDHVLWPVHELSGNCLSFLMVKILGQCREQKAKEKLQHTVDYLDVLLFNNNGRTERQAWEGRCDCDHVLWPVHELRSLVIRLQHDALLHELYSLHV
eukprot:g11345.t1